MSPKEFKRLYERCSSGKSTPYEQKLFEEYKDNFDLSDIPWTEEMGNYQDTEERILKNLNKRILKSESKGRKIWYWSAAAASLLIILTVSLLFIRNSNKDKKVDNQYIASSKIIPGSNKAILITEDGNQIDLDSKGEKLVSVQSRMLVLKDKSNRLIYQKSKSPLKLGRKIAFNTLIIPRGGQYELVLSDGTKVWMNADSRLKYPISFEGTERVVELEGEAYFEVAKNKLMPFKVITGKKTVRVLGTHFNVSAYPDEPYQITLLEGSVKLNYEEKASTVLIPGEQATLNSKSEFDVAKVNATDAIAWKEGIFLFKNENIQNVMKKISRWYDIDVEYQGDVYDKRLGGMVSRYADIQDLLKTISLTGSVHFKINGRRVTVMP